MYGYDFFVCECLMLEGMNFFMLMTHVTLFLLNLTKTCHTHAPKKSCDLLQNHI